MSCYLCEDAFLEHKAGFRNFYEETKYLAEIEVEQLKNHLPITIFRPSEGSWYSTLSSTGGFFGMNFGLPGDIPVAGDYDKDGKTDIAVYRPADGNWYIMRSSDGGFEITHFGLSGDIPLIAR